MDIDTIAVGDADDARKFMLHHLQIAARFFELTDEDLHLSEVDEFSAPAIKAWVAEMENLYKD